MATLSAPTLDEILTEVRVMLNQPDEENSNVTNEELTYWINEAVRRYFAELVQNSEGQFATTSDLDLVGGTESVALPSDCFRVKTLYRKTSSDYISLAYVQGSDVAGYSTTSNPSGDNYVPTFYIRGNNLILRPIPASSETAGLKLEYIQFPSTLVDSGDSVSSQVSPIFRDLIIAYTVYKAKLREGNGSINLTASFRENLNDLFTAFKESITPRAEFPQSAHPWNPEGN